MNIFARFLGSISEGFESIKSSIAGYFGYDEAQEEIAAQITPETATDAEIDNSQDDIGGFYESIYNPDPVETTATEIEEVESVDAAPPVYDPYGVHPEQPVGYKDWRDEADKEVAETYAQFAPDAPPEETIDNPPDTAPEYPEISRDTWAGWDQPDDPAPEEDTSEYEERTQIARDYGLDDLALVNLTDKELEIVLTSFTGNGIMDSEVLDNPDEFLSDWYDDATLYLVTDSLKDAIEYMGNFAHYYKIDIFHDSETDKLYYAVIREKGDNNVAPF